MAQHVTRPSVSTFHTRRFVPGLIVTNLLNRELHTTPRWWLRTYFCKAFCWNLFATKTAIHRQILGWLVDARFQRNNFYHQSTQQQKDNTNQIDAFNTLIWRTIKHILYYPDSCIWWWNINVSLSSIKSDNNNIHTVGRVKADIRWSCVPEICFLIFYRSVQYQGNSSQKHTCYRTRFLVVKSSV